MSEGVSSYLKNLNRDCLAIFLLIALAASVRIYLYSVTCIISRDGVTFLTLAEYFYGGDFAKGLSHDYHPAYPMLISALFYPLKDYQLAGQMISIVAGSLLVLPVFYLGKGLFNKTIGFGAGVLVVFHPYLVRFSTDVLSDSLYILFFITGICIGWRALEKRKPLYFFLAGVSTALAYLTRPEGVGILVVLGFWVLIIGTNGIRLPNKKDFACTVLLTLGFILVASPYLIYLKEETGHWTLTKKKDIKKLIGIEKQESGIIEIDFKQQNVKIFAEQKKYSFSNSSETGKPLMNNIFGVNSSDGFKKALKLFNKFMETFHPALLLLTLFSLCRTHRFAGSGKSQLYVLSFFLLYVPIIFFLLMNIGYASRRHILPLCVIGLFWAAFGMEVSRNWIMERIHRRTQKVHWSPRKVYSGVLIVTVLIMLPITLKPQRTEKLWIKQVGLWIQENSKTRPRIIGGDARIAHYAGGLNVGNLHSGSLEEVKQKLQQKQADYVILNAHGKEIDESDSFSTDPETLNLVNDFMDHKGRRFLIYKASNE